MAPKSNQTAAIILAAGKGTRMKSDLPKVLHEIGRRSMLAHVMDAAKDAGCHPLVVVTAPDMVHVERAAHRVDGDCRFAVQTEQLGTGHAVLAAKDVLEDHAGDVLVLFGDSPLMRPDTFRRMTDTLRDHPDCAVVVLGFDAFPTPPYGRLILGANGELERIVEARDASEAELSVRTVNSGVMAIRAGLVWTLLAGIGNHNAQKEYYLTDIVAAARKAGHRCLIVRGEAEEMMGVNSRADLAAAEHTFQQRRRAAFMEQGVTMIDPSSVFFAADTIIGRDVTIEPNVYFGTGVRIEDGVEIRSFSHIDGAHIGQHSIIGPFARLRPGTVIGEDCKIGNFVEIKKSTLERDAKVSHLSYIGDATVGAEANIGAGTITCNYDGYNKYETHIGSGAFIGSNSALVAPVTVGEGAIVAAGSVVTEDVEPNALAVARTRQSEKENWAAEFRHRKLKDGN